MYTALMTMGACIVCGYVSVIFCDDSHSKERRHSAVALAAVTRLLYFDLG